MISSLVRLYFSIWVGQQITVFLFIRLMKALYPKKTNELEHIDVRRHEGTGMHEDRQS